MKRFIIAILATFSFYIAAYSQATDIVVDCQTPGWLSSKINYGDQQTVMNLKVTGYINDVDLKFIGSLMEDYQLHGRVDLSDVNVVGNKMDSYTNNFGLTKDPTYSIQYLALPKSLTELSNCLCNGYPFTTILNVDTLNFSPDNINYVVASFFDGRQYQSSIKHLILDGKVDSIPDNAFSDIGGVSSVKLPIGMKYIGYRAFYQNYKAVERVNFNELKNLRYLGVSSFDAYAGTNTIAYYQPDTLIIPRSLNNPFYLRAFNLRDGQHIFIEDNINEVSAGVYDLKGRWQSSYIPAKLIFHINNTTPPALTSISSNANLSESVVYVPKGSKQAYLNSTWKSATIIEVAPQAILNVTASGNGSVSYNGTNIKNQTQSFTVDEGTSATVTFAPDEGYRVANVKLDDTDITLSIVNNSYTINSISANTTLEVKFEVIPPSIDITKYISVYSAGGSISRTNDLINSGSQLNWRFSNNSDFSVTLKSLQLIDGATNQEGNIMSVNWTVDGGSSVTYSTTIGALGLHTPVTCRFRYDFYGNEYSADAVYPITYTLTIKSTGGGYAKYLGTTIRDESKSFSIEEFSSPNIYFTPDDGYRIKSLLVDGKTATSSISLNRYSINLVTGNKTIEVEFEAIPPTYTFNITSSGNGSVSYNNTSIRNNTKSYSLDSGASATVTITPDVGNKVKSIKLNNLDIASDVTDNQYTISNINSDNTLEVEFETITHILSIKAIGNGSATYNSTAVRGKTESFTITEGTSAVVMFTPDTGYKIKSVILNSTDITSSVSKNQYTINDIKSDNTLEVEFEAITHTLSITATDNGSATYDNNVIKGKTQTFTVNEGTSATVAFTPDAGYKIASVKVNGTDITTNVVSNTYTITNISADVTLIVTFEAITHTLSITASGNGSATYNSTAIRGETQTFTVNEGTSATVTFIPDAGYRLASVKVNGTDVTTNVVSNAYTITNISANVTLTVTFEAITHTLSITASGNGSASYNSTAIRGETQSFTVNEGTSATVTFTPDAGYKIASVKVNGTDVTESVVDNKYTIGNISADVTLTVTFEAITHTLSIMASGNGSVTYNSTAIRDKTQTFTLNEGSSATVTIAPDAGYRLASVMVNGTDVTSSVVNNQYTISNITENTTLSVSFTAITHTLSITASGNGSVTYYSTAVRGKTQSFAVNEGTSAVITITPDTNYKLKSVKLNGVDIASSIVNGQYTISDIKSDNALDVVFEGITHTLNIKATGNGLATFNETSIRGKSNSFTVNEGSSATVKFTPDANYQIKSVKLNNIDVTSSVSNSRYTISNIKGDNTLEVEFEPIINTLSITAIGNGIVTYNGTTIREGDDTYSIMQGSTVVISLAADSHYKLKSVKQNGTDVTSRVIDNQYTIDAISGDTSIEIEFEAIMHTLSISSTGNGIVSYNNNDIRSGIMAFKVMDGSSATIAIKADVDNRLKRVVLNGQDVTSDILDGKLTLSNITGNNTLEVEFEPIPTYELNITASGSGSLYYGGKTIRNQSREFMVKEGSVVTITVTPDNGYRVGNIMMNSEDITAQLAGSQLSVTVTTGTNVEVNFEAIPIVTFTQTVKATGNGTVSYNGTDIRNTSKELSIAEGTYATFIFTPDAGHQVKSVILNGEDITSSITNNQYTISNVSSSNVLEVEFIEVVSDLAFEKVNYRVVSQDEQTVIMTGGSFGLTLTVPATFEAEGKKWTVTDVAEDALKEHQDLAAIIWEPEVAFTAEVNNPNLLLYVKDVQYAPSKIQNVVVNDLAENIVLVEAAEGNNFYCPKAFTAQRISYSHNYSMRTGYQTCQGWETIVLPFDVTMITNAKGTELVPYVAWQDGSSQRPFWLYQLTAEGWQASNAIKANVPYIISMPNNELYHSSYNQSGYIEFVGNNVQVATSDQATTGQHGNKRLVANYQVQEASSSILALNVSNEWHQNTATEVEGSAFIRSLRTVHPFEAYMTVEGSNAPWAIPVFDNNVLTDIIEMERMRNGENEGWYDLQGRKLQGEPKKNGIYLHNGKKVKK